MHDVNLLSEGELKILVLDVLSKDFIIKTEWDGVHFSGQKKIIDAVIRPKDNSLWARKNIVLGIEFKGTKLDNTGNGMKYIRQCIDYSNTYWYKLGYIPIFMCPPINETLFDKYLDRRFIDNVKHLLIQFNIGELSYRESYGWLFTNPQIIWSEKNGIGTGKRHKLITKFGST